MTTLHLRQNYFKNELLFIFIFYNIKNHAAPKITAGDPLVGRDPQLGNHCYSVYSIADKYHI